MGHNGRLACSSSALPPFSDEVITIMTSCLQNFINYRKGIFSYDRMPKLIKYEIYVVSEARILWSVTYHLAVNGALSISIDENYCSIYFLASCGEELVRML